MTDFLQKLRQFLHDPPDKCLDIKEHEKRANKYASSLNVDNLKDANYADQIASSMERSLLPEKKIYQDFTQIRHPLSESFLPVSIDKNKALQEVEDGFSSLSQKIEDLDEKKKFFYLWRNLTYELLEKADPELKKFLPILPADTRIPDHSIWEHLKITSAISAYEKFQNNSLFLLSIGPVQGFIFQARKTKDFFMGSFILSYLTFMGMTEIIEKYGPTSIIYPDLFGQPLMDWYMEEEMKIKVKNPYSYFLDQPTIPNRFVAIIPETDSKKIEYLAKKIEEKIRDSWKEVAQKVLIEKRLKCDLKYFKAHICTFPEIYWVALPLRIDGRDIQIDDLKEFFQDKEIKGWEKLWNFAENKGEFRPKVGFIYQLLYTALEKEMGARKNLRDFEQQEEEGKKCHVCGERKGIFRDEFEENERLCFLCFTKRNMDLYLKNEVSKEIFEDFHFPSTSEISLSKFKEKILKDKREKFEEYVELFRKSCKKFNQIRSSLLPKLKKEYPDLENIDGEWLLKENLTEKNAEKLGINKQKLREIKDKLKEIGEPTDKDKYYAVIMLDGDNMGKWLSGRLLPDLEHAYNSETWDKLPLDFKEKLKRISKELNEGKRFLTPAIHATISHALRNYSIEFVRRIVEEEHLGKLVYSGGDDVLAFVSIYELFEIMRKLRAAFSGHIRFNGSKIEVDWRNNTGFVEKNGMYFLTMGKNATASCGVAIAHYKAPFRIALLKARDMEKKAKSFNGKDAFAICLMKHSGEERVAVSHWRYGEIDVLEKMIELRKHFSKRNSSWISDRFIYTLRDEFKRIKDKEGKFGLTEGILNSEIKRVIKRSVNAKNEKEKRELLRKVFEKIGLIEIFWSIPGENIDNFLNLLEITSFTSPED